MAQTIVKVALDKPLIDAFDYLWGEEFVCNPCPGMLVEVPFGRLSTVGIIVEVSDHTDIEISKLKKVRALAPLPSLDGKILGLAKFAAEYYVHGFGETIIPAIPKWWRTSSHWQKGLGNTKAVKDLSKSAVQIQDQIIRPEQLNQNQKDALSSLCSQNRETFKAIFLNGVTGSGKTAVYLNYLDRIFTNDKDTQALILLPEINLTPQLERRIRAHLPDADMVVLHSGLSDKQRAKAWYAAITGQARIILGTRLSILTPIPNLAVIVVDEENDGSFKQQEGLGYSARDLAVWRAKNEDIPVILSSATPSLETWHAVEVGRYEEIKLSQRINHAEMPAVELVQIQQSDNGLAISPRMKQELYDNYQKGRQALVFVNRRGFAPVLVCKACGWLSECKYCSSYAVMHRRLGLSNTPALCCHHCGLVKPIPRACPKCGDSDLMPLGRGTQKLEEQLQEVSPQVKILRVDADTARTGKLSEALFAKIHQGDADIIVGTQMLSKGHDYQNIGLVCVLDADARLYSNDYRAPELLFAQLIQVAGRAGRSGGERSKILIETRYPNDPVYQYLMSYDVAGFMQYISKERHDAGLPPFAYHALVHAESKQMSSSLGLLGSAKEFLEKNISSKKEVRCFDPIPKPLARIGGKERAQLLIEAASRAQLQIQLNALDEYLRTQSAGRVSKKGAVRWSIERDPLLI